ncbi:hypothetical protein ACHQM5_001152 [Ranunculus cassubicifolius]
MENKVSVGSSKLPEIGNKKPTKLLVKVTVQQSLGPIQVVTSSENTVEDLIKLVLEIYVKEKRRPLLNKTDPRCFELHYSQFCLDSLSRKEKLVNLGSRNYFLCSKMDEASISSCSNQVQKTTKLYYLF